MTKIDHAHIASTLDEMLSEPLVYLKDDPARLAALVEKYKVLEAADAKTSISEEQLFEEFAETVPKGCGSTVANLLYIQTEFFDLDASPIDPDMTPSEFLEGFERSLLDALNDLRIVKNEFELIKHQYLIDYEDDETPATYRHLNAELKPDLLQ